MNCFLRARASVCMFVDDWAKEKYTKANWLCAACMYINYNHLWCFFQCVALSVHEQCSVFNSNSIVCCYIALLYMFFPIFSWMCSVFSFLLLKSHLLSISCVSAKIHLKWFIWWNLYVIHIFCIQFIRRKKSISKRRLTLYLPMDFISFYDPQRTCVKKIVFCVENISLNWKRVLSVF